MIRPYWFYIRNLYVPRKVRYPMPDSIEFQLDCMIHRTQITERYPFTKIIRR